MLSNEEIREILGQPAMTDEQVRLLREDLYVWLNRAIDEYFASTRAVQSDHPSC